MTASIIDADKIGIAAEDSATVLSRKVQNIRKRFLQVYQQDQELRGCVYNESEALSAWYCSEAFTMAMLVHAQEAKQQVLKSMGEQ